MTKDVEMLQSVERDTSTAEIVEDEDGVRFDLSNKKCHEKLDYYMHRPIVEYVVIFLIVIDALLVVASLLIELHVIQVPRDSKYADGLETEPPEVEHERESRTEHVAEALHYTSLAILTLFMVEVFLKLFAQREKFFKRKIQIIDGFVVVLSFAFDIVIVVIREFDQTVVMSLGLIIVLRLWRLVRIVNGAIVATKLELEEKIHEHKREANHAKQEVADLKVKLEERESEIDFLKTRLSKYEHVHLIPEGSTRLPAYLPETRGFPKYLLGENGMTDDEDYSLSGLTDPSHIRIKEVSRRAAKEPAIPPAGSQNTAFTAYQPGQNYNTTSQFPKNEVPTQSTPLNNTNHPHNPRAEMYVDNLDVDTADESDVMSLPPKPRTGNTFTVKKDGVPMTSL